MIIRSPLPSFLQTESLSEPGFWVSCKNHARCQTCQRFLHALGEAEHGEPLDGFFDRPVEINVLFEPVQRDFHRQNAAGRIVLPRQLPSEL